MSSTPLPPETRYAAGPEGYVAYQAFGSGPPDLVFMTHWATNLDTMWDEPSLAAYMERLASFSRVICYDKRGSGVSDPVALASLPTIEERTDDARVVLDAVGVEQAALLGDTEGGPMAAMLAASHPERVSSLVLVNSFARWRRVEEFLTGTRGRPVLDRLLATVLFTDIVGSTRLAAERGDRAWITLARSHDEIVREHLKAYRGREVDHAGDGFLAVFDGPARAVMCAFSLADALREIGITIRVGLHTGEIELVGDAIRGLAVHIAARVMSAAEEGGVVVSSTVKDLVIGSGIAFADRGTHRLKDVPGDWQLFDVVSVPAV